ncbi:transposase-like protein [Modicisalibacter xianhensis]|uniref:Transposase-like protein n=1 Tax=Modicisalibacter xianhensis TaxID=442341 RepID=A0A4R8FA14_9GAMM|nr:transposase-like protein [Halomonas xianhensis]
MTRKRRSFTPEFKQEAACLVLGQGYSITEACRLLGISESVLRRSIKQLAVERDGITPTSKALMQEQRIQELEARIHRLEREKAILITIKGRYPLVAPETLTLPILDPCQRRSRWLFGGPVPVKKVAREPFCT